MLACRTTAPSNKQMQQTSAASPAGRRSQLICVLDKHAVEGLHGAAEEC